MTGMGGAARRLRNSGAAHQVFNPVSHRCAQAGQGKGKGRLYAAPASNPYEAPGCQESKVSRQRIFAFFAAYLMLASLAIGRVS
jgi:hypothetical protein